MGWSEVSFLQLSAVQYQKKDEDEKQKRRTGEMPVEDGVSGLVTSC